MYNLTDYNASALRIILKPVQERIEYLNEIIAKAKQYIPEGETLDRIVRKDCRELEVLREHSVHLLTALQIVKDRETVLQN